MTEKEILNLAFKKAMKNGWHSPIVSDGQEKLPNNATFANMWIFDHSFCKAFFGEEIIAPYADERYPAWAYHIQQLALAEDRLKYLEGFI